MNFSLRHACAKNYFLLLNEIFCLGLSPGEIAVYSYLLCCENRKTHHCWPSYKTIGRTVGMSVNTVRKHICSLADKGLITTENTSVITQDGLKRNGNLMYTIRPIQEIAGDYRQQQLRDLELNATRWETRKN